MTDSFIETNNNQQKLFVYVTCGTRIYHLQGIYDINNNSIISPFVSKGFNLLHTRSFHQIRILEKRFIAIFSQIQVTIYSITLQYIGRIEEKSLQQVSDVLLAPNLYTLLIADVNNILIYSIKVMNSRQRLILQTSFPYIMPIIYSVKFTSIGKPILTIKGVDAKDIFNFQYFPQSTQNPTKDSTNCLKQIKSIDSDELQQQQYISILKNAEDYSDQTINIYLSVEQGQKNLKIPTIDETLLFLQDSIFLKQRLHLDVDLNGQEITLVQNKNAENQKNLLKSLKITNGSIKLQQKITLQSMYSVVLKNVKIYYENEGQLDISDTKEVRLDNSEQIFSNIKNENDIYIINFRNIENSIINKVYISDQVSDFFRLFSFTNCTDSLIKQLRFQNTTMKTEYPIIKFQQQSRNITIQDIMLNQTNFKQFLFFTNTQNIYIKNIIITHFKSYEKQSVDVFEDEDNSLNNNFFNNAPLIYSEFAQQDIIVNNILVEHSLFNKLLYIQNWMDEIKTVDKVQIKLQRISSKSKTKLIGLQATNSTFVSESISIDDNEISLESCIFTKIQDGLINLKNANIYLTEMKVKEHIIDRNNTFLNIFNSKINIQQLQVNFTKIKEPNKYYQNQTGYISLKNCSGTINDIIGIENNIQNVFMSFYGIYKDKKALTIRKLLENDIIMQNCLIERINKGGALMIEEVQSVFIEKCNINHNQGVIKGGGMSIISSQYVRLKKVDIQNNLASVYGGGLYLDDSYLEFNNCIIRGNQALIGGGIKYANSAPQILTNELTQITENKAIIFGNNYASYPKTIHIKVGNNTVGIDNNKIIAVSSSNQQVTEINFQLFDEENNLVKLPFKSNQQIEYSQSEEILGYLNDLQLHSPSLTEIDLLLKQDLESYYNFKLSSKNDILGQISIQQKNLYSTYEVNKDFTHSFKKYILHSGYSFLSDYTENKEVYQFEIQSPIEDLTLKFDLMFRKCIQGEIIKQVGNDYYECMECSDNTYSLSDPYSNKLQNICNECPQGAQSCNGNQIIPMEGNWVEEGYSQIYFCINTANSCIYDKVTRNPCTEGYQGPLCESCTYDFVNQKGEEQHYAKKGKYSCSLCSDKLSQSTQITLSFFLGLAFLLYLSYQIASNFKKKVIKMQLLYLKRAELLFISNSLNGNEKSSFALKILIGYFQIISIVFSFKIQFPEAAKSIQIFGSSLETTLYSLDCLFAKQKVHHKINIVYLRLLWVLFQPFLYIGFLCLIYFFASFFIVIRSKNRVKNLFLSGLLKLYYMIYPSIIQQVIGNLSCKTINDQSYILNDLQFKCYDDQYYTYNFGFGLPVLILALIAPYLILRKLRKSKEHITQDPNIFISYGFYFSEYKYKYCYWEIIKIYQKILIFILIGLFNENNMISSILVSIIIIFYIKYQLQISPFTYLQFNQLDHLSQITAVITILSLVINITSQSEAITYISIIFVVVVNTYFFYKFIVCFSYHIIRQPNFRFVMEILIKIQKLFPRFISPIQTNLVNILRQTKNWKLIKHKIVTKSFQGMYSYNVISRVQFAQQSTNSIKPDMFDQRMNTERRLLSEVEFIKDKSNNRNTIAEMEDSIGQEYLYSNQITVRTQQHIQTPGKQLKLLSYDSQESKALDPYQKPIIYSESNINTEN